MNSTCIGLWLLHVLSPIFTHLAWFMLGLFSRSLEVNMLCLSLVHSLQDDRINRAEVLFPGVACFLIAAILGLFVHASNTDDVNAKLGIKRGHWLKNVTAKEAHEVPASKGAPLGHLSGPVCSTAELPIRCVLPELLRSLPSIWAQLCFHG